ncbi:formylglycine-generating enzyme family protein [Actinokineospora sp.]|uniref:formylglycine-generating enzyme family protein n=1 Tax=Actinokineospora sp. TaxID=1872133 RepID=UPI0040384F23
MSLEWIEVPAGICRIGDYPRPVPALLWTATPITYGHLPDDGLPLAPGLPVTDVTHADAARIAELLGGRLPTSVEWQWMAAGPQRRPWPWGDEPFSVERANLLGSGHDTVTPVDAHPDGATPEGLLDVAGNVWEWTADAAIRDGVVIRGGSYATPPVCARCTYRNTAPPDLRSPGIGFRLVRPP